MPIIGATRHSFFPSVRNPGNVLRQAPDGSYYFNYVDAVFYNEQINPSGGNTGVRETLEGFDIPSFPTPWPSGSAGQSPGIETNPRTQLNFSSSPITSPPGVTGKTTQLKISGSISRGGLMAFGPALVLGPPVSAQVGDSISFQWSSAGGGDAYNVFAYILNKTRGVTYPLFSATGSSPSAVQPWTTVTKTISAGEDGMCYFIFICGTFDYTFGTGVGAILQVSDVILKKYPGYTP